MINFSLKPSVPVSATPSSVKVKRTGTRSTRSSLHRVPSEESTFVVHNPPWYYHWTNSVLEQENNVSPWLLHKRTGTPNHVLLTSSWSRLMFHIFAYAHTPSCRIHLEYPHIFTKPNTDSGILVLPRPDLWPLRKKIISRADHNRNVGRHPWRLLMQFTLILLEISR